MQCQNEMETTVHTVYVSTYDSKEELRSVVVSLWLAYLKNVLMAKLK